ncbi:hypothetical protein A2U01_0000430, partial [Trifolium medium]|nr:hypothetical protein [Trifolium medium]
MDFAAATVSRDEYIRDLMDVRKTGVAKIYIRPLNSPQVNGEGWSGFLIAPDTILTIGHALKDVPESKLQTPGVFWVEFFEDRVENRGYLRPATLTNYDIQSEFGLMRCPSPKAAHIFTFASQRNDILSSSSILSVSHPIQRDWVTLRGTVCRPPFTVGGNPGHGKPDVNMVLFDHDVQTFAGASGAPMMNLSGEVIGIQCFEVSQTEHGYCIPLDKQNHKFEYDYSFNDYDMTRFPPLAILPLKFIPSNIKQAIAVQYINKVFRKVFKNERASEDCDLNEFISGLFKQRIGKPSSSSAPPTGKSSPLGLTGTMQHTSYEDSRLKSVIRSLAPSVVSVSYFTGIHRIVDCTGFIIDWDVCKGVATVLTSAKLMRSPLDRHDYRIVVRLANGKMLLAEEDYVDYYHNIVTFKKVADYLAEIIHVLDVCNLPALLVELPG